jgi:hypothetical protein
MRFGSDSFHQCSGQARLPDTGFTGQQNDLAFSRLGFRRGKPVNPVDERIESFLQTFWCLMGEDED